MTEFLPYFPVPGSVSTVLYYIFFVAKTNNHNREQVDFLFSYLVQVALRIRPMAEDEIIQGAHPAAYKVENNVGIREF